MAKGEGKRRSGPRKSREHWKDEPDAHDYPAASDYLGLLLHDAEVAAVVGALETAPIVRRKAKDLLRASRLALLGTDDPHVAEDLAKVRGGARLSPVLIVRGALGSDVAMTIADGYHRVCASYHIDEDADIPCHIVDPPGARAAAPGRPGASSARRGTKPSIAHGRPATPRRSPSD